MSKRNYNTHIDDINIRLMVPLITIVLCTACLCATTWAWYTASITSGTSTITAGAVNADVSITLISTNTLSTDEEAGIEVLSDQIDPVNGYYTLYDNFKYQVAITNKNGTSSSGYHCMFTVTDGEGGFLGIFYTNSFDQNGSYAFTITPYFQNSEIKVKVDTMWGVPPQEEGINKATNGSDFVLTPSVAGFNLEEFSDYALRQAAIDEGATEYNYTITYRDMDKDIEIEVISDETDQEVLAIHDYKKEGYEFVSATNGEVVDDVLYLEIDTEAESTDFVIYYQKIVVDSSNDSNNIDEKENIDSEVESSETTSEGTEQTDSEPPVLNDNTENAENNKIEDINNSELASETPELAEPDAQTENIDLNENDEEVAAIDSASVDTTS